MIAILQPFIPHYREEFFHKLSEKKDIDIFTYESDNFIKSNFFKKSSINTNKIKKINIGGILFYNLLPLLNKKYDTIVLMARVKHFSSWLILVFNLIFKKNIILWGHGISVKNYTKESIKQPFLRKLMYKLSTKSWFYTKNELNIWKKIIPEIDGIALNNTFSGVNRILNLPLPNKNEKTIFKNKYNINTNINLLICARFTNPNRKAELLIDLLNLLDNKIFGLIVIGDGPYKPDFINYSNVYDFGSVYDYDIKKELFFIADLYIQPAWIGLSGVEALSFGLPIFTLSRNSVLQCVEFSYLLDGFNAVIRENISELSLVIQKINMEELKKLQLNAKAFAQNNLSIDKMVSNALKTL